MSTVTAPAGTTGPGRTIPVADLPTGRVLRRLVRLSPAPRQRLAAAALLGIAAAMGTVALLAGSGYVVARAAFRPGLGAIAGLLAMVEVVAFIRGPLRYGERLVAHDAAFRALTGWRLWLYDRLEPLAPSALGAWRSGDLLARVTADVDTLGDLYLRVLLPAVVTMAAAALAVVVVAVILPLAGLVLAGALLLAMVSVPLVALATGPAQGREAELHGRLGAEVVELVQAAPDLVAFGREEDVLSRVEEADRQLTVLARRRALATGAASALVTACVGVAVVGVLAAGVAAIDAHRMSPVMLAVLPLAAVGAFESVPALGQAALRARDVAAAGRRMLELEDVPVPVTDPEHPEPLPPGCPEVVLRDVHLRYGPDLPWALRGLDLVVPAGSRTAVVGPSGAGKSSVVHLLLRFSAPSSGSATLGGVPFDRLAQADVRRAVALVDQHAHLFAGTIRQNVLLGRPGATEEEVARAVAQAQLGPWVATLPQGLDTPVGEHGAQVSGGQRQRIALARALLAGAPVLVLDEPTSGLDEPTAERLLADVLAASEGRTVLMVTHRPRDLRGFDHVVAMDAGRAAPAS